MPHARTCKSCNRFFMVPDAMPADAAPCPCGARLPNETGVLPIPAGSLLHRRLSCPDCGLVVVVPHETVVQEVTCLVCSGTFTCPAEKPRGGKRTDFGEGLLEMAPKTTLAAPVPSPAPNPPTQTRRSQGQTDTKAQQKTEVAPEKGTPGPIPPRTLPQRKVAPEPVRKVETPAKKPEPRKRPWALVVLVPSLVATIALVAAYIVQKPTHPPDAQFLPENCGLLLRIDVTALRRTDAFRQLREAGDWDDLDEGQWLSFLGAPLDDIDSILAGADLSGSGRWLALVNTQRPIDAEILKKNLRLGALEKAYAGSRTFLLAENTAYCLLNEHRYAVGERAFLQETIGRDAPAKLAPPLAAFLNEKTEEGVHLCLRPAALAGKEIRLHEVDVSPLLASLTDFTSLRLACTPTATWKFTLRLEGGKRDLPKVSSEAAALWTKEGFPFGPVFDGTKWKKVEERLIFHGELAPAGLAEPLLRELVPAHFWLRVFKEAGHPKHAAAAQALVAQGRKAVPGLVRYLGAPNPPLRIRAIKLLAEMGQNAASSLPALGGILETGTEGEKIETVRALPRIATRASLTRKYLMLRLKDPHPQVRKAAGENLDLLPQATVDHLPDLLALGASPHPELLDRLLDDLGDIGLRLRKEGKIPNPALVERLFDGLQVATLRDKAGKNLRKVRPFSSAEAPFLLEKAKAAALSVPIREFALKTLFEDKLATGKAEELIDMLQRSDSLELRRTVAANLAALKVPGDRIPAVLLKALHDPDGEVRLKALGGLAVRIGDRKRFVPPLIELLEGADRNLVLGVVRTLENLGPTAYLARPLLEDLSERGVSEQLKAAAGKAMVAVGRAGPADVVYLADLLETGKSEPIRYCAAKWLAELGPRAAEGRVALSKASADADTSNRVREQVLIALRQLDTTTGLDLVPSLSAADPKIRLAALRGIPALGPKAQLAFPAIGILLEDANKDVRLQSLRVLEELGGLAGSLLEKAGTRLEDGEPAIRMQAIRTLAAITKDHLLLHPFLRLALKDEAETVRRTGLDIIRKKGAVSSPLLAEALERGDGTRQLEVLETIAAMKEDAAECNQALATLICGKSDQAVRVEAIKALGTLGKGFGPVADQLEPLLHDSSRAIRRALYTMVEQLGSEAATWKKELAKSLRTESSRDYPELLAAFRALGLPTVEAAPMLISAFRNPDPENRGLLIQEVKKLGRPSVYHLVRELDHPLDSVRLGTVMALGELRGEASTAIPPLQRRWRSEPHPVVRQQIIRTLQMIGE